jgi:hypothetical protein
MLFMLLRAAAQKGSTATCDVIWLLQCVLLLMFDVPLLPAGMLESRAQEVAAALTSVEQRSNERDEQSRCVVMSAESRCNEDASSLYPLQKQLGPAAQSLSYPCSVEFSSCTCLMLFELLFLH